MAISLITAGASPVASGSTVTATTTVHIPIGSLVVICIGCKSSLSPSAGDSAGNPYSFTDNTIPEVGIAIALGYCLTTNDLPVGSTIELTGVSTAFGSFVYGAFSGATAVVDVSVSGGGGSTTNVVVNSGTFANASEIAIAFTAIVASGTTTYSQSSGFLNLAAITLTTAGDTCLIGADYAITSSTASLRYQPTLSVKSTWGAGIVSFIAITSHSNTTTVGQSQTANSLKIPGKLFKVQGSEYIKSLKAVSRFISIFNAESVSSVRGRFRSFSVAGAESIMLQLAVVQELFVSSAENVLNKSAVKKLISSATTEVIGRLLQLSKQVSVAGTEVVSATRASTHLLSLSVSSGEFTETLKSALKVISLASAEVVLFVRFINRVVSVKAISGEAVKEVKALSKAVSLAQGQATFLFKTADKVIQTISEETVFVSLIKSYLRKLSTQSTEAVSVLPSRILVRFTKVGSESVAGAKKAAVLILSAAGAEIVNLARGVSREISVATLQVEGVRRGIARAMGAASSQTANTFKTATQMIQAFQAQAVNITRLLPFHTKTTTPQSVSEFNQRVKLSSSSVFQPQTIFVNRNFSYVFSVISSQVINLGRATARSIYLFSAEVVSSTSSVSRAIGSFLLQAINAVPSLAHLFFIVQSQSVNLLSNFYHRRRLAIWMRKQNRFNQEN